MLFKSISARSIALFVIISVSNDSLIFSASPPSFLCLALSVCVLFWTFRRCDARSSDVLFVFVRHSASVDGKLQMAAHKTFIVKRKLAKAQKQNRPMPPVGSHADWQQGEYDACGGVM